MDGWMDMWIEMLGWERVSWNRVISTRGTNTRAWIKAMQGWRMLKGFSALGYMDVGAGNSKRATGHWGVALMDDKGERRY
mmetsp:Transcript_11572/g.19843  ORF Transcript_11572/g.19843 Transcript_11572/m.19843 type:complete len:80 (+) Transcript_11572:18-257(+)